MPLRDFLSPDGSVTQSEESAAAPAPETPEQEAPPPAAPKRGLRSYLPPAPAPAPAPAADQVTTPPTVAAAGGGSVPPAVPEEPPEAPPEAPPEPAVPQATPLVDISKKRRDHVGERVKRQLSEYRLAHGEEPSSSLMKAWAKAAQQDFYEAEQAALKEGDAPLVDKDPDDVLHEIQKRRDAGTLDRLMRPYEAWWGGRKDVVITPEGVALDDKDAGLLGKADWLFSLPGLDPLDAWALVSEAQGVDMTTNFGKSFFNPMVGVRNWQTWGTDKHVELIEAGESFWTLGDEDPVVEGIAETAKYVNPFYMALEAGEETGAVPEGTTDTLAKSGTKMLMAMASPDVFAFMGPAVGFVRHSPKVAEAILGVTRSKPAAYIAEQLSIPNYAVAAKRQGAVRTAAARLDYADQKNIERNAKETFDHTERAIEILKEEDAGLARVAELAFQSNLATARVGSAEVLVRMARAKKYRERLDDRLGEGGLAEQMARGGLDVSPSDVSTEAKQLRAFKQALIDAWETSTRAANAVGVAKASRRTVQAGAWRNASQVRIDALRDARQQLSKELNDLADTFPAGTKGDRVQLDDRIIEVEAELQRVTADLAEATKGQAQAAFDDQARAAEDAYREAMKQLRAAYKAIPEENLTPEAVELYRAMMREVGPDAFRKFSSEVAAVAATDAMRRALDDLDLSYGRLLEGWGRKEPDVKAALAWQAEMASTDMAHTGAGWIRRHLLDAIKVVRALPNPGSIYNLSLVKRVSDIEADGHGMHSTGLADLHRLHRAAPTNDSAALKQLQFDYLQGRPTGVATMFDQLGTTTLWELAKPLFRAMAVGARTTEYTPLAAVLRAYLPRGVDLTAAARKGDEVTGAKSLQIIEDKVRKLLKEGVLYRGTSRMQGPVPEGMTRRAMVREMKDQAARDLTIEDFVREMRIIVQDTLNPIDWSDPAQRALRMEAIGKLEASEGVLAASILSQAVIAAATMSRTEARMKRAFYAEIAAQTTGADIYRAAEAITEGRAFAAGPHFTEAMNLMTQLGMPATATKRTMTAVEDAAAGLRVLEDPVSGENYLIYRLMASNLEARMNNIVKTGEPFSRRPGDLGVQALGQLWHKGVKMFSRALLSGIGIPRAGYYALNWVGDISQIFTHTGDTAFQGATTAAAVAATSAASHAGTLSRAIPYFGPRMEKAYERMAAKLGGRPLPFLAQAILDGTTNKLMDPLKAKGTETIRTRSGKEYTFAELRKAMVEYGVSNSFAGTVGLREVMLRDPSTSEFMAALRQVGDVVTGQAAAEIADALDVRRRVALFADLVLRQDMELEAAAAMVKGALFDWNSALMPLETQLVKHLALFWGFQRRALDFGLKTLVSGYAAGAQSKSARDVFGNLLNSPYGRTYLLHRSMTMGRHAVQSSYPTQEGEDVSLRGEVPTWANRSTNRFWLYNLPSDPDDIQWYKDNQGRVATHEMLSMPNVTSVEQQMVIFNFLQSMIAVATEGDTERLAHIMADIAGPLGEAVLEYMDAVEEPQFYKSTKGRKVYSPTERLILHHAGETWRDPEDPSIVRVHEDTYKSFRFWFDHAGVRNLARYVDPLLSDPIERRGYLGGMGYIAGQWSQLMQTYPTRPAKTKEFRLKDEEFDRLAEEARRRGTEAADEELDFWGAPRKPDQSQEIDN